MLEHDASFQFTTKWLSTKTGMGLDAVTAGLKLLEKHGYLYRYRIRENGRVKHSVYEFYEEPDENPRYTPNENEESMADVVETEKASNNADSSPDTGNPEQVKSPNTGIPNRFPLKTQKKKKK